MTRGRNIPYSEAELAWIEARKTWPRKKAHAAFCKQFGRDDISLQNFKALCERRGWRTGRRPATPYSAAELAWIEAHGTWPRRKAHEAFCQRSERTDVTLRNFASLCERRGWRADRKIPYSGAELAWIKARSTWPRKKAHAAFCKRFGRDDVSLANFKGLCKRRGWRMGYRRKIPYSATELAWIKAHSTWPRKEAHAAFCKRFGRTDVSLMNFKDLCRRRGWRAGWGSRFEPFHVPSNPTTFAGDRSRARNRRYPPNAKPLGHEYIATDGYVMISVAETNPYTGAAHRFVQKHRHLWQQVNGPIPEGHRLKCRDGNKTNTDPSNWMAVPRGRVTRRNKAGPERRAHPANEPRARQPEDRIKRGANA